MVNYIETPQEWQEYWTKYPNGYTIYEALVDWASKVNLMVDQLNLTTDQMETFLTVYTPAEIESIMDGWYADGSLATLITQEVLDDKLNVSDAHKNGLNVKMFGAIGDNTADDTAAINAAIAYASANGIHKLYFPAGTYKITNKITMTGIKIIEGESGYSLISSSDNTKDIIEFPANLNYIHIKDIHFQHVIKGTGNGIVFLGMNWGTLIENVTVANCNYGFYAKYQAWLMKLIVCQAVTCNNGFFFNGQDSGNLGAGTTIHFDTCYANDCLQGFYAKAIKEVLLTNCAVDHYVSTGVTFEYCSKMTLVNIHTEANNVSDYTAFLFVTGGDHLSIDGINIEGTTAVIDHAVIQLNNMGGIAEIKGLTALGNTNIKAYIITESTGQTGRYIIYPYTTANFIAPYVALALGKLLDVETLFI